MKATFTLNDPPITQAHLTRTNISDLTKSDILEDITFLITKSSYDQREIRKDIMKSFRVILTYTISNHDYEEAKEKYKQKIEDLEFVPLHTILMEKIKEREFYIVRLSGRTGKSVEDIAKIVIEQKTPNYALANVALLYNLDKYPTKR